MKKRDDGINRVEGALRRAYQGACPPELGQAWQDDVMRAVRREAAVEEQGACLAFRTAWVGALCSAVFFVCVFHAGFGLKAEIANAALDLPMLGMLSF